MKNKIVLILLIILSTCFFIRIVEAKNTSSGIVLIQTQDNDDEELDCDSLFGDPEEEGTVAHYLQEIFTFIKYLGPALAVIFTIIEFFKAAAAQDNDALAKAVKKTGWRIALAVALFFLPNIIDFTFTMVGWYGTCGIR